MRGFTGHGTFLLAAAMLSAPAAAQVSSLSIRQSRALAEAAPVPTSREGAAAPRNPVYEQYSWITLPPAPPRKFRPGDLITIIVREQRQYEADADLETKRKYDVKSELDAFVKPTDGGLGSAMFRRGKPNIDYKFDQKFKSEGDTSREDRLTTRMTGKIIDVKPNGLLVVEARARMQHDDEISVITLTGVCRKDDVTADNTVLSTQIADKNVAVRNEGALRSAASRGWITRLLDLLKPI